MTRSPQYGLALLVLAAMAGLLFLTAPGNTVRPDYKSAPVLFEPVEPPPNPFRKQLWLNGKWRFRTGQDNGWHTVVVPHAWNSIPGLENYVGKSLYSLEFEFPDDWRDGRTFVCFGGLAGYSEVRVNGELVSSGFSRYTPLEMDITDFVDYEKKSVIEVSLDNSRTIPGLEPPGDEKNFGGIYREAYLELRKDLRFRDVRVQTLSIRGATATIIVSAALDSDTSSQVMVFGKIQNAEGAHVMTFDAGITWNEDGSGNVTWEGDVSPVIAWTPRTPELYVVSLVAIRLTGTADGIAAKFGIVQGRNAAAGNRGSNDNPPKLRGVTWREQMPGGRGPVVNVDTLKTDLDRIETAGFNAVRFAHPVHPAMLDECDRRGLFVVEEFPVPAYEWLGAGGSYVDEVEDRIRRMILRDRNRPSIVAWGLSVAPGDAGNLSFGTTARLTELIRSLDGTRPVYIAARGTGYISHPASDFNTINMFGKSARAQEKSVGGISREYAPGAKQTIVVDYGAQGIPGNTGEINIKDSETDQTNTILTIDRLLGRSRAAAGWFLDSFADYEGPLVDPRGQNNTVFSGLLTSQREPKLAYEHIAGLSGEPLSRRRSITGFVFPGKEFLVLLMLLVPLYMVWAGYGLLWPAFVEPEQLAATDDAPGRTTGNLLFFGLPMLLAGAAAAAFAFSALAPHSVLDPTGYSAAARSAVYIWMHSYRSSFAVFFGLQLGWLLLVSLIVSIFTGGEPLRVFELLSRCVALRPLYIVIPFLPFGAPVIVGAIMIWEIYLQHNIISRVFGLSPIAAATLLVASNIAVCTVAATIIHLINSGML